MKKFDFFSLLFFSILLVLPIFINISATFPRLDTDYDSNLPVYQYMVSYIRHHGMIPSTISVVTTKRIPVWGDPLNSFFNPFLSIPLLLFGINTGIRISIFFVTFLSGITMWVLTRKFKINRFFSLFASFLYMSAGTLVAQIASGHIEKFLIYPIVPLFLYFILEPINRFFTSIVIGLLFSTTIYSGDLYATWFFLLFLVITQLYYVFLHKNKKIVFSVLISILLGVVFSLPKLYPFLFVVLPEMERYFVIQPFLGSIHAVLLLLFFIVPFQVSFYDRPFFQHHLGFAFNWYEYYAFLTPLPFVFLLKIKKIKNKTVVQLIVFLIVIASLYLSMVYVYSPFHWLVILLGKYMLFRVPQRIVLPLTSIVVLLLAWCGDTWFRQKNAPKGAIIFLCLFSILWTIIIFWQTLMATFPKINTAREHVIALFANINKEKLSVVTFAPETQFYLVSQGIPIANYYYGWIPKETETYLKGDSADFSILKITKPAYILATPSIILNSYSYTRVLKNDTITIWKRN